MPKLPGGKRKPPSERGKWAAARLHVIQGGPGGYPDFSAQAARPSMDKLKKRDHKRFKAHLRIAIPFKTKVRRQAKSAQRNLRNFVLKIFQELDEINRRFFERMHKAPHNPNARRTNKATKAHKLERTKPAHPPRTLSAA